MPVRVSRPLILLVALFFIITAVVNTQVFPEQQYVFLARSFLSGKTYFLEQPGTWWETAYFAGHYYWHLGPLPAVILMPFVFVFDRLGGLFFQGYLQFFFTLGIFGLALLLARKQGFSLSDGLLLAFAFCFASIYQLVALVPWSWYFVQVVSVLLVFWAIWEWRSRGRLWLTGTLMGLALAARFPAGLGLLFFTLSVLQDKSSVTSKAKHLLALVLPGIIVGLLLLGYNYSRFGDPWEDGHRLSNNHIQPDTAREQILFHPRYIPQNFYYYFLKSVDPVTADGATPNLAAFRLEPPYVKVNFPGISFFLVSPIFLYVFRSQFKNKTVRLALVTSLLILLVLLAYYWPGWRQVGPRYLLDLLPFGYLLLLSAFPKHRLTALAKTIIVLSAVANLFLLVTAFT